MTEAEAQVVVEIVLTADGGCHICGANMVELLEHKFPDQAAVFHAAYEAEHELEHRHGYER